MRVGFSPLLEEYLPEDIPPTNFKLWKQETPPPSEMEIFDDYFTSETISPSTSVSFGELGQSILIPFELSNVTEAEYQEIFGIYQERVW